MTNYVRKSIKSLVELVERQDSIDSLIKEKTNQIGADIEIQKILDLGVHPTRIIYANPYKQISFLKYAADNGVALMTFDCDDELEKIKEVYPAAKYLGIDLMFIHTGFANMSTIKPQGKTSIKKKVRMSSFKSITASYICKGIEIKRNWCKISTVVNNSLDKYFNGNDVRIIAEPGQFYVSSAFTIATNIISKKLVDKEIENITADGELHGYTDTLDKQIRMYYVNDGIYGCFFDCLLYPGWFVPSHFKDADEKVYDSIIWGPTCDAVDLIIENIKLPELKRGEWVYFKNMGAYAFQCVTSFNSMPKVKEYFICERVLWEEIYPLEQSRLIKTTQGEL
ncbi:E4.1.1.17 [Mytilus edulis]|uniref:E4.1.1.17 n=1 Tax=Mytilus edulis TaxID=6550 RepID=A0A8S3QNZ6_MYTED|nr:E4.1.1.17 [Mytilus edulis]